MEYLATSLQYLTHQLKHLLEIVVLEEQSILSSGERQEELDTLLILFSELCEIAPSSIKKRENFAESPVILIQEHRTLLIL
jgi:hypothetical protein